MSLAESFEILKSNSLALKSTQNQTEINDLELAKAKAQRYLNLNLTSTHGYQNFAPKADTDPDAPWVSRFSIDATQKIYDFGLSDQTIKIANQVAQTNSKQIQKTLLDTGHKLAKLFLDFTIAKAMQNIKKIQAEIITKQFSQIDESFAQGLKTRTDFLRSKANLQRTSNDLVQNQAQIDDAAEKILNAIKSQEKNTDFRELELKKYAATSFSNVALQKNPNLLLAEDEIKIADSNLILTRKQNGPELNLKATAGYGSSDYMGTGQRIIDNDRVTWGGLLEFNVPIWDGRLTLTTIEIAAKNLQAKVIARDQIKDDLNAELKLSLKQYKFNQNNFKIAQDLTQIETENYTFAETEYLGGRVGLFYLNDSLRTLIDARVAEIQALADCARAYFAIKYLNGDLIDEITH